jgi:hypothetical protein
MHRLAATHLRRKPDGMHADGNGLYLKVRDDSRQGARLRHPDRWPHG